MTSIRLYFYVILQTCVIVKSEKHEIGDSRTTVSFADNAEESHFVDPHSFDYDRANKKMVERRKVEYQWSEGTCTSDSACRSELKECKDSLENIEFDRIYTTRLINLLLFAAKLEEDGDLLSGSITVSGQKADIEKLRGFSEGKITMREVDVILSKIITPTVSVFTETITWIDRLFIHASKYKGISTAMFSVSAALATLLIIKYVNWSAGKVIVILLAFGFLVSYFMIQAQMIQKAEIKRFTTLRKHKEPPKQCDPEKMNLWDVIVTHFDGRDQCYEYYKAMELEPIHAVTPLDVLPEIFDRFFLQLLPRIGSGIGGFIDGSTKHLWWPMNTIVTVLLYLGIPVPIILLAFLIVGCDLRIWFGPFFGMSIGRSYQNHHHQQQPAISHEYRREPIMEIPPVVSSRNHREPIANVSPVNLEHDSSSKPKQLIPSPVVQSIDNNQLTLGGGDSTTPQDKGADNVCRNCCCEKSLDKSHIVGGEDLESKATKSDVRKGVEGEGDC